MRIPTTDGAATLTNQKDDYFAIKKAEATHRHNQWRIEEKQAFAN